MGDTYGVLDDLDYDALVAAVQETARGRWFLREHERRIRAAETRILLAAIARLEGSLAPVLGGREETDQQLEALASVLHATRAGMAAVSHPLLEGGGALPAGADAFDFMAVSAREISDDVAGSAGALQSTSQSLEGVDGEQAALEREAAKLLTVAYRQEVLSRRVAKAAGALSHIDHRLKGHLPKARPSTLAAARTLTADQLKYFQPDEDMFAAPSLSLVPAAAAAKPEAAGAQVLVIRKGSGDIPLFGEDAARA